MDPFTIMALGSTALTAVGKLGAGFANSSIDQVQRSVALGNVQLLTQKANLEAESGDLALYEGRLEQARTIANLNRTLGAETGKFAASNLDPTYGSPLLLEGFSAGQGATDLALIGARASLGKAQALGTAAGTMAEAAGQAGQAAGLGMKATGDVVSGIFGAGASALAGLGKLPGGAFAGLSSMFSGDAGAGTGITFGK